MKYAVKVGGTYVGECMGILDNRLSLEQALLFDSPSRALAKTVQLVAQYAARYPDWGKAPPSGERWDIVEVEEILPQPRYREGRSL